MQGFYGSRLLQMTLPYSKHVIRATTLAISRKNTGNSALPTNQSHLVWRVRPIVRPYSRMAAEHYAENYRQKFRDIYPQLAEGLVKDGSSSKEILDGQKHLKKVFEIIFKTFHHFFPLTRFWTTMFDMVL